MTADVKFFERFAEIAVKSRRIFEKATGVLPGGFMNGES